MYKIFYKSVYGECESNKGSRHKHNGQASEIAWVYTSGCACACVSAYELGYVGAYSCALHFGQAVWERVNA